MSTLGYIKSVNSVLPMFTIHNTVFYLKKKFPFKYSAEELKLKISQDIPFGMFSGINSVFFGEFEYISNRGARAISYNNSIFITSEQESLDSIVKDLTHELGHNLERKYYKYIHKNKSLSSEFIHKKAEAMTRIGLPGKSEIGTSYDRVLDDLFSNHFGLENLEKTFSDLVVTPYSLISLSEYFSEGVEYYLKNDILLLQRLCPVLYNVIETTILESN